MKGYFRSIRACVPVLAGLFLAACASTGPAPVEDLSIGARRHSPAAADNRPSAKAASRYRVQRGDTLYSIAFRNGLDYRDLADWNRIGAPYTIYVGQELRVTPVAGHASPPRAVSEVQPAARANAAAAPARPAPFQTVPSRDVSARTGPVAAAPVAAVPPKPVTGSPPAVAPAPAAVGDAVWRWPADGQVVGSFAAGDPTRQGIDIAGKAGDPVRAAAAGTVVYSGNGLIGYGELIIVKHNATYLSAYGHNRKRLVKEGDRVGAGQTIAEMGSSSADRDSLHFEIRKNGKPVNPIDILPAR